MLSYFTWDVSSEIFEINLFDLHLPLRWYGVLFAIGFLVGQQIVYYLFRKDGKPSKDVDSLTIYLVVATIIGARLGHYLFYEWEYLLRAPGSWLVDLIIPPYLGLASHGATIAIPIALYLYSRKRADQSFLWVMDRVVIPVALGGAFIRFGNFMNSEIYGKATSLPWGVMFVRETNPALLPAVPSHPTQLYEAAWCLIILAITFGLWKFKRNSIPEGTIAGVFLILLFSFRFFVEFLKNNQESFENNLTLNMGQLLSIPAVLMGIIILVVVNKKSNDVPLQQVNNG
jgi:phosphatidylglycerol:prolipoprotein diacylglycerol transferase